MKLSLVIPTYNEAASISGTVAIFHEALRKAKIAHEILIIDDDNDETAEILKGLGIKSVKYVKNPDTRGFGHSIRHGLDIFTGDCVAIVMGDMSDRPED